MNDKLQFDIEWYKKQKSKFWQWCGKQLKNGIRIVDENDCAETWNAAIGEAIKTVKKTNGWSPKVSNDYVFNTIVNLKKLKHNPNE